MSLSEKVKKISNFLKDQGIVSGDRVAIISENTPNWGIAYFAITTMGAVAVPIMTEFQSADVHHILNIPVVREYLSLQNFMKKLKNLIQNY